MKLIALLALVLSLAACDYSEVSKTLPAGNGVAQLDAGVRDPDGKVIPTAVGVTIVTDAATKQEYIILMYSGRIAITPRLGTPLAAEAK